MRRKLPLFLALSLLSLPFLAGPANAQPDASVSGLFYTDYSAPTDGRAASFNVTRAFLTGKVRIDPTWSGAITYNAAPLMFVSGVSNGAGTTRTEPFEALLQTAYLQASGLLPGLNLQMGMVSNPWFEFETGFWGYRMLGLQFYPVFNAGYIPTYDLGLRATGRIGAMGYMAQVDNGTGFRSAENNAGKAYTAGLTLEPLSGLTLAAFGYRGDSPALSQADRYAAFAGYRNAGFRVAAEATHVVTQSVGGAPVAENVLSAYSVMGLPVPALPSPEVIARVDLLDGRVGSASPDTTGTLQGLLGFSIKPAPGVMLVLNDQVAQETRAGVASVRNTVALHTQLAF